MAKPDTAGAGHPEHHVDVPFTQVSELMPELAALAEDRDDVERIEIPLPNAPEGTRLVVEVPRAIAPFLREQLRPERIGALTKLMAAMDELLEPPG